MHLSNQTRTRQQMAPSPPWRWRLRRDVNIPAWRADHVDLYPVMHLPADQETTQRSVQEIGWPDRSLITSLIKMDCASVGQKTPGAFYLSMASVPAFR